MTIKVFYTTLPTIQAAETILSALLDQKIVACGNILPSDSHYEWNGVMECSNEVILLCKTTVQKGPIVSSTIEELHPYEIPAVLNWDVDANPAYAEWVMKSVV